MLNCLSCSRRHLVRRPVMSHQFTLHESLVGMRQPLLHPRFEQRRMRNVAQVFSDEPWVLFGGHPVEVVKARQVDGTRITPQGALAPEIYIDVEVTHGKLTQRAEDGVEPGASRKVRPGHRAPTAP